MNSGSKIITMISSKKKSGKEKMPDTPPKCYLNSKGTRIRKKKMNSLTQKMKTIPIPSTMMILSMRN